MLLLFLTRMQATKARQAGKASDTIDLAGCNDPLSFFFENRDNESKVTYCVAFRDLSQLKKEHALFSISQDMA